MRTATISLFCPAMPVRAINRKLRRTAVEPMIATITFDDGTTLIINPVTIPETDVNRLGLLHWQVDTCVGYGKDVNGNIIFVYLPVEPVLFSLQDFAMVAQAIPAAVTLTTARGDMWKGEVVFPKCASSLLTGIAESVTATGEISLP